MSVEKAFYRVQITILQLFVENEFMHTMRRLLANRTVWSSMILTQVSPMLSRCFCKLTVLVVDNSDWHYALPFGNNGQWLSKLMFNGCVTHWNKSQWNKKRKPFSPSECKPSDRNEKRNLEKTQNPMKLACSMPEKCNFFWITQHLDCTCMVPTVVANISFRIFGCQVKDACKIQRFNEKNSE